jgi:hypothetical protein
MQESYCERCKINEVNFMCIDCKPINFFCTKCDSIVHTLPSKKQHKREFYDKDVNKIPINDKQPKVIDYNSEPESNLPKSVYYNSTKVYTREYVNELKNIFEKEKQELIFKNSSLQNNLDRLKNSFGEQVLNLHKHVDDVNLKSNFNMKMLEGENYLKYQFILNEKDTEIEILSKQVEDFKQCNEELMNTIKQNLKQSKDEKIMYNQNIDYLEKELALRQNETDDLRYYYEEKINNLLNSQELALREANSNIKDKLNQMTKDQRVNIEILQRTLDDRENEIKCILNQNKTEESYFKNTIRDHKDELDKMRNEKSQCN